jgi:hypothetical protein
VWVDGDGNGHVDDELYIPNLQTRYFHALLNRVRGTNKLATVVQCDADVEKCTGSFLCCK